MELRTLEILEAIFGILAGTFFLLWMILIVYPYGSTTPPLIDYFFNPFFLLIIAFGIPCGIFENLRRKTEIDEEQGSAPPSESLICPQCGTQNINTAKFCQKCGAKLP